MFYCNNCKEENKWPESLFKSFGKCEICDKVTECNSVPSRLLPIESFYNVNESGEYV